VYWFGPLSYGVAALTYGAVTAILLASYPGGRSATWITFATAVATLWAAGIMLLLLAEAPSFAAIVALDALHSFVWTACMLSRLAPSPGHRHVTGRVFLGCVSLLLGGYAATAALFDGASWAATSDGTGAHQAIYLALLGSGLVGLLTVEQVFRNAGDEQRNRLRLLCFGIGGLFVVNVFVYSQASLLNGLVPTIWEARGLVSAALAPLIVLAIKRQFEWERDLFVSRQVAFYTTSLVAVGIYLLAMGVAGYAIRAAGGQWGLLLEVVFLLAALIILVFALFSASIRARAKTFLVKHFYRNKYDYRVEWLRLTASLSKTGDARSLAAAALDAIMGIIGSGQGTLWTADDGGRFERRASSQSEAADGVSLDDIDLIVAFLGKKGWVIDTEEYAREPDLYGNAFGDPAARVLPRGSIIVPLDCQGRLHGFVILEKPRGVGELNFEDHDLLKTAGRQVAVVLAQAVAQEKLSETRQFEAVNKLATFLTHDLKNLIAQQELVVANAQRFRDRPQFIDDAFATVRSGVERMRKLLDQLHASAHTLPTRSRADVTKVLMMVQSNCADREPVPQVRVSPTAIWVNMDRDQLASVFTHLIRNAQDATPATGSISIDLERSANDLVITVSDTGKGMDKAFIRERLFRPFDTTKGAQGMGIGAYQVREIVRSAGGDVEVHSELGVGTRFRVRVPAASVEHGAASTVTAA
jgi:putative PEP-CTERM system histidine kinase